MTDSLVTTIKTAIIGDFVRYQKEWFKNFIVNGDDIDLNRVILDFLDETAENYISERVENQERVNKWMV